MREAIESVFPLPHGAVVLASLQNLSSNFPNFPNFLQFFQIFAIFSRRFIRSEEEDAAAEDRWALRLAKRYYSKLYREYAIVDLSRYQVRGPIQKVVFHAHVRNTILGQMMRSTLCPAIFCLRTETHVAGEQGDKMGMRWRSEEGDHGYLKGPNTRSMVCKSSLPSGVWLGGPGG